MQPLSSNILPHLLIHVQTLHFGDIVDCGLLCHIIFVKKTYIKDSSLLDKDRTVVFKFEGKNEQENSVPDSTYIIIKLFLNILVIPASSALCSAFLRLRLGLGLGLCRGCQRYLGEFENIECDFIATTSLLTLFYPV